MFLVFWTSIFMVLMVAMGPQKPIDVSYPSHPCDPCKPCPKDSDEELPKECDQDMSFNTERVKE